MRKNCIPHFIVCCLRWQRWTLAWRTPWPTTRQRSLPQASRKPWPFNHVSSSRTVVLLARAFGSSSSRLRTIAKPMERGGGNLVQRLRLVVYLMICEVLAPSQVVGNGNFWTINSTILIPKFWSFLQKCILRYVIGQFEMVAFWFMDKGVTVSVYTLYRYRILWTPSFFRIFWTGES